MKKQLLLLIAFFSFSFIISGQTDTTRVITEIPVVTVTVTELEGIEETQDISGLLSSSRDIFVSTAGFTFGPARFRIRGLNSENTLMMINGVPVNDEETGRPYWSAWGGLNDATRNTTVLTGTGASREGFGGIGGISNIITRASTFGKTIKYTQSVTNRNYRNRAMIIAATGMMDNNWAVTFSGSRRWAQEGFVEGTFYDGFSYFLSVERKLNSSHSLGFLALGAPTRQGMPGVSTQEAYDLTGSNYYNPNWGLQNGEKRNARVNEYHNPIMMLSHYWQISPKSQATTSVSYTFGKTARSYLNWYDANDPRPDYYRYLPSYYSDDEQLFNQYTNNWLNNDQTRQIDWEHFYFANSKNLFTLNDVNGIEGNDITFNRSKYILEDRRTDKKHFQLATNMINNFSERITFSAGLNASVFKGNQFKVVNDLLGGDYWVDVDQFAERDATDPIQSQTDIRRLNRLIDEGDKFGYDYTFNINTFSGHGLAEFELRKFDIYAGLTLSQTSFWRTGHMQTGLFPDNSFGDSKRNNFFNFGLKAGLTWKVTGRNFIAVNGAFMTRAPLVNSAYISPRTRDQIVGELSNETIFSGDISYIHRSPSVKSRVTLYYAEFLDQIWARSFYHEEFRSFVNYQMTGVNYRHMGIEFGTEINISPTLSWSGVAALGEHIYNSRPFVTIARDNNNETLANSREVYLKNFKIGGTPQTALSTGLRYNSTKYWFAGINLNYLADLFLDINPDRRTAEALDGLVITDPQWDALLEQKRLPDFTTLDLFAGKSWRINNYFIALNVSVNNILNNTNLSVGGFEQLRFDQQNPDKFAPKYFYLYGRGYFINLNFRM
jgi:hypothetical protein